MAAFSLVLGTSLASAMLNISFDIGERMEAGVRGYGPNILIVPRDTALQVGLGELSLSPPSGQGFIREVDISKLGRLPSSQYLVGYTLYLYSVVEAGSSKIVLAGTLFDQAIRINPSWNLKGEFSRAINDTQSSIVGVNVADRLGLQPGSDLYVKRHEREYVLRVAAILSTGGSEDSQVFVALTQAQTISQKDGLIHLVEASYKSSRMDLKTIAEEIVRAIPSVDAKIVSQVSEGERSFLSKIQATMIILTLSLLTASGLAVMSTMSTTVLERRRETGLMMALGASSKDILTLFIAEASGIGIVGGLSGYVLGLGFASTIWLNIFNVTVNPRPASFFVSMVIALAVSLLASLLPIRQALRMNPSNVLRSE